MCFWCFDVSGPADPGGTAPPKASWFLEIVHDSHLGVHLSDANQLTQTLLPQPPLLSAHHLPGPSLQDLLLWNYGQRLAQSPKIIQTSQPWICLPFRACSFPRNYNKGSWSLSPNPSASWPTLVCPQVAPPCGVLLSLRIGDWQSVSSAVSQSAASYPHTWITVKPTCKRHGRKAGPSEPGN